MISKRPHRLVVYTIAVLLVPLAIALTFWFISFFNQSTFAFFYLAVYVSTWCGGRYPGLATTVLSLLAIDYFFIPPLYTWALFFQDGLRLGIYSIVMLLFNWLTAELINARRRVEIFSRNQLEHSRIQLQQALQAANMGVWDYDLQTGKMTWSPEHEQLFGLAPGTFDGQYETFEIYIHPDDRQRVQQSFQQVITQRGNLSCKFRIVRADGNTHWVEGRGQVVCGAEGQPICLSGTVMNIDDRIQAEQALQQLNQELEQRVKQRTETLEAVFDRAAVGMNLTSPEGTFIKVNQAYCDILGYTPEELLRIDFDQITHPEDIEIGWQERKRLFSGEIDSFSLEKRYIRKDGRLVWVNIVVSSVHKASGEVDYAICVVEDVSQRKDTEAQLRSSEARYRAVVEDQTDLIVRFLSDSTILFINDAYCRYFGVQREDLIGKSYVPIIFEADREAVNQQVQSISDENSIVTIENRVLINGEIRWTQWINRIVSSHDGQFIELQAVGRDITDLKQIEESLRISENRLKLALDGSGDGLWEWNIVTGEIYLDSNWLTMLGYAEGELPLHTSTWSQLVHPDDYPWVTEQLNAHFQDINHPFAFDYRMLTKAGDWKWLANYGRVVARSDDGTPLRMVGTHQDISNRKRAEEQLRISAERISLANAELSRAARLKDEFLAGMSHELRTPLNAILGMSEVLLEEIHGRLTNGQRDSVTLIERSGQHLLALINDILDLAKVESGKMDLEISPVQVQQLCDMSLSFIKQQAYQKHIQLHCNIAADINEVELDGRRIEQVLINLLSNAVKFTPEGGRVQLLVRTNPEQDRIEFAISDTGIGIPPDQMNRLFQPFVQLDSSLSRRYSGTGLGLALVRRIVELHGGSVTVTSEVGQGSCFTVILPWRRIQQTPELLNVSPPTDDPTLTIQRVLIVDDSESAASQVSRYLAELGTATVVHPLGKGVIDLALRIRPDVIILDILLPDLSGWEVLIELKAHPLTCTIPVLIVSVVDERAKGLALGAAAYLLKPITGLQLQQVLNRLMGVVDHEQKTALLVANQLAAPLVVLAEDNEANIEVVLNYLQAKGLRTAIARNGLEAVQLVKQCNPALVLMDIQMPEMDGLKAISQIRADADLKTLPIIALTALAMPGDRERCLAAGANEYLSKPVSLKQLLQVVQQYLPDYQFLKE